MIPASNDMRFEVTTKCNYNCIICPRETLTRKKETMSLELFKSLFDKIMDSTGQYDTISFPGMGEPLMDETLAEKMAYAKSKKKDITILLLTNGSLLTPDKFKELEDIGLDSARVSFYGNDPQAYSKVHGVKNEGMFAMVRDNLLKIAEIKKTAKLYLTLNVVDGGNDSITKDWISFWENKVDLIEVWKPHNWVDAKSYRCVQQEKNITCGRPFKGPLQIQVDGTVNMCCFDYDGKLTLGDLKVQTMDEVFSSKMFDKIKKCHQSGDYKNSNLICEGCDQRNVMKDDVAIYNSKFDIKERVNMVSTTYEKID